MNKFAVGLAGILGMMLAAIPCAAQTNRPAPAVALTAGETDTVEKEYQRILADDDDAQSEVDRWIQNEAALAGKDAALPASELSGRIRRRFQPVRLAYEDFLKRHPDHVRARIAYGSFLNDLHETIGAEQQWEQARALDPSNPAVWNNLAKHYASVGPISKAFEDYDKAIELKPDEPLYRHNLGNAAYAFRRQAMDYYHLTDRQVCEKVLELYTKALKLDPSNFPYASDVAQVYYALLPVRTDEALRAWTNALALAHDDLERQGVYLHYVRLNTAAGRFAEAHTALNAVVHPTYGSLKDDLARGLAEREHSQSTNAPAGSVPKP